jgi:hypothetical protein
MTWDGLESIDDIRPLSAEDRPIIAEVRDVLARHGALERFGLTLLHSHFELEGDEVLVEEVHSGERLLTTRPRQTTDETSALFATSFRLDQGLTPMTVTYCYRPKNSTVHMT